MNTNAGDARKPAEGPPPSQSAISVTHSWPPCPQDAVRLVHDVARRRGRQLVGDEGEDHIVLGRITVRKGSAAAAGARVRESPRYRRTRR